MEVVFFFLHRLFSSSSFFLLCIKIILFSAMERGGERRGERGRGREMKGEGWGVLRVDGERREEGEKMADW